MSYMAPEGRGFACWCRLLRQGWPPHTFRHKAWFSYLWRLHNLEFNYQMGSSVGSVPKNKTPTHISLYRPLTQTRTQTCWLYRYVWLYKVVQIWPGLICVYTSRICPGHIWTTLYNSFKQWNIRDIWLSSNFRRWNIRDIWLPNRFKQWNIRDIWLPNRLKQWNIRDI